MFFSSSLRLLFYCHCCRCQIIITSNIIIISLLRSCCGRSHASSLPRLRESGPPLSWSSPSSSFISNRINDQRPLLAFSLSWYSAAAVSQKSRVRTPHMPELFQAFFAMIFFTIHSLSLNSNIWRLYIHHFINPLSLSIHMQILQTDLHTFLLRIVERIWFKIKAFSFWLSI